jgi:hypothetical protein
MVRKSTHGGIKKIALWFCMLVALMEKFLSFLIEKIFYLYEKISKKIKVYEEFIVPIFIDFSLFMMNMVIVMMMIGVLMWWLLSPHKTTTNSINFFFEWFQTQQITPLHIIFTFLTAVEQGLYMKSHVLYFILHFYCILFIFSTHI